MFPKPSRKKDRELLDRVAAMPCAVCGNSRLLNDPSHIRSRGAGGPDTDWNVVAMCRRHHTEWHAIGYLTFLDSYPSFRQCLLAMGWSITGSGLWHQKLSPDYIAEECCDGCKALGGDCYCDEIAAGNRKPV